MNEKNKLTRALALHIVLVSVSVPVAIMIAYGVRQLRREIEWAIRVDFGVDRILRARRGDFVLMALGAALVIAGLVSLVRMVVLIRRLNRMQGNPIADASSERAVTSARSGGDKYLAQLDEYLKNGIIDREEYKVLKQRHLRR